jgi:hypothetical protein
MKKLSKFLLAMLLVFGLSASASGAILTYNLSVEFSGAYSPDGNAPWLTATFDDEGTSGSVYLTLSASGLTETEYVAEWYFNVEPYVVLDFGDGYISANGSFADPDISQSFNAYMADGDGHFDILFKFATAPPADRFTAGDSVVYLITGQDLTAYSFFALSQGAGNSPDGLYTAAQIRSINTEDSGWITVPIPPAALLLGSGLLGLIALRRRMKK